MKTFLLPLLLFCSSVCLFAQSSFSVELGPTFSVGRQEFPPTYIGQNAHGHFFYQTSAQAYRGTEYETPLWKRRNYLMKVSPDLSEVQRQPMKLPQNELPMRALLLKNKRLYLFSQAMDRQGIHLRARSVHPETLTIKETATQLYSFDEPSSYLRFHLFLSPDSTKIGMMLENDTACEVAVFDQELGLLWSRNVPLPDQFYDAKFSTTRLTNQGNFYLSATVRVKEPDQKSSKFRSRIFFLPRESATFHPIPDRIKDSDLRGLQIFVSNEEDFALFSGHWVTGEKKASVRHHVFFFLDEEKGNFSDTLFLSSEQLQNPDPETYDNLVFLAHFRGPEGKHILVAEEHKVGRIVNPPSNPSASGATMAGSMTSTLTSERNDILVLTLDSTRTRLNTIRIPKRQVAASGVEAPLSFTSMLSDTHLYFIFNEKKENLSISSEEDRTFYRTRRLSTSGIQVVVKLNLEDDSITTQEVEELRAPAGILFPASSQLSGQGEILLMTKVGKTAKLAKASCTQ